MENPHYHDESAAHSHETITSHSQASDYFGMIFGTLTNMDGNTSPLELAALITKPAMAESRANGGQQQLQEMHGNSAIIVHPA